MPQLQVFRNATQPRATAATRSSATATPSTTASTSWCCCTATGSTRPRRCRNLLQPILDGEADAVFGSRMMEPGAARRGGMPLYKYVGNKILTRFENAMLGMNLSEFHSGYRVYSVEALEEDPVRGEQRRLPLRHADHHPAQGRRPAHQGGADPDLLRRRDLPRQRHEVRARRGPVGARVPHAPGRGRAPPRVRPRAAVDVRARSSRRSPATSASSTAWPPEPKVLDVGCAGGYLARALRRQGLHGGGRRRPRRRRRRAPPAAASTSPISDGGDWAPEERDFDYVLFGDVLEHLRDTSILAALPRSGSRPSGQVIASTGNVALWFMRLQLLSGRFRYAPRGILDETHVQLYTRDTFRELVTERRLQRHARGLVGDPHREAGRGGPVAPVGDRR